MNKKDFTHDFSNRLKTLLENNGLIQRDLARRTGISEMSISRYCAGQRLPNAHNLYLISQALGCTIEDLTGSR